MEIIDTIQANSDQINAVDLIAAPKTITVESVKIQKTDQPVEIFYGDEEGKSYRPSKSMRRVITHAWGPKKEDYIGRSMTLYCDPDVMWAGKKVGGIKISHMTHIDGIISLPLTERRGVIKPHTVKPLKIEVDPIFAMAEEKAAMGVAAYKSFLESLDDADKQKIRPEHKRLSGIAKMADEEGADEAGEE